ncbi:MAG TPA: 50S ribosomal protein L9 [Treponema sp.]|nr:50S ribosomal protein L9 [Treponema sp.]
MKVILNVDVKSLGEEGDVKNVANGYYRNFLGPRNLAVPYNDATVAAFESRKAEIEARKEQKRSDSAGLKEKLEALSLEIVMPSGKNGKLFGAVTAQVLVDLLAKQGFEIERKRIDIPGLTIKSVGNYHFSIKLYETQTAEMKISVKGQEDKDAVTKESAEGKKEKRERKERKAEPAESAGTADTESTESADEAKGAAE